MIPPITLTERAERAISERLQNAPSGTIGLRLFIGKTGCSGHSYQMAYVSETEDISADDIIGKLHIARTQSWMLFGMNIDFNEDALGNAGFQFHNPNEKARCGCGESFNL